MASITVESGWQLTVFDDYDEQVYTAGQTWTGDYSDWDNYEYESVDAGINRYSMYSSHSSWTYTFYKSSLSTHPSIKATLGGLPVSEWSLYNISNSALPSYPNTVKRICYENCPNLTTVHFSNYLTAICFKDCTALTTIPAIPSNIVDFFQAFEGCTSLTGDIIVNANYLRNDASCFRDTILPIKLKGANKTVLRTLAATANNGNVSVGATMDCKVNGAWKNGEPTVKVNGAWKDVDSILVKVNGAWKESS